MVDPAVVAAVALLVGGVVGSVVPLVPGALLSLGGVVLYWWSTGYTSPGPVLLAVLVVVALATLVVDYFAGAISAKAGGASTLTTVIAAVVGLLLFFVTGPLGIVLGIGLTVFAVEYYRHRDAREGARAAAYAAVGVLGSALVQAVLTGAILLAMLAVIVL